MENQQKWIDSIKNLPTWVSGAIGLATVIISFVVLVRENYYLGITIIGGLLLVAIFCLCIYLVFAKTPPLIEGGKGVYRFEKHRPLAVLGSSLVFLIIGAIFTLESSRSYIVIAFNGTATPTVIATIMPSPTKTTSATQMPSLIPTLTATPLPSPAVAPGLGFIDLTKDRNIELAYDKEYLSRFYNELNFIVSNTGDENFLVDSIWLELISIDPYEISEFPEDPGVPVSTHDYSVTINPNQKLYLVTDDNFFYEPGEVEGFNLNIRATESGYIYQVIIKVDWYNLGYPENRQQAILEPHFVDFPIRTDLYTILKDAEQVDYFLYDTWAIGTFINGEYPLNAHSIRFLTPPNEYSEGLENPNESSIDMRFTEASESINLSYYGTGDQYLIVDNELVIQHIGYYEAELIRDPEKVQQYIHHFNQLWDESQEY